MTKSRSTKHSLLMSILALMMCVSMFVGSTFAWFTDSVTSSGNIIKSGTLDVTMEWADGKEKPDEANWKDASTGAIFDYDKWEPGYTEVRHIKIANEGTLALKYQLNIVANGEVSKLADVIDVYYADPAVQIADRTALAGVKPLNSLTNVLAAVTSTASGELLAGESHVITIALKMQETAGNEYQDLSIGSDFSVQLLATQLTYEEDSFDHLYDDLVMVSDAGQLKEAIAAGKSVMLAADINVDANTPITVADDANVLLDLNGFDITGVSTETGKNRAVFVVKGEMSVVGTGNIYQKHTAGNMGWNNLTAPFSVEGGELTLGKGVTVANLGGTDMAFGVDVNSTLGETVLNVDGATIFSTYTGVRFFNNHKTAKAIVNYNSGLIVGENRDIWKQSPSASAVAENAVLNIADGYTYSTEATSNNGCKYFFEDDMTLVSNADALADALANGGNVVLVNDITMEVADTGFNVAKGISAKLNLNGHDIIATSSSAANVQLFSVSGNLEIVGKGTISLTNPKFAWTTSARYTAINIRETGVVTLGDGVNVICEAGSATEDGYGMTFAVDIYTTGTLNVNGASLHSNYIAVRCFFGASVVNFNSGSITSSRNNWGIWKQSADNATVNIDEGINYTTDTYGIYIFG